MKGGCGARSRSFCSTLSTTKGWPLSSASRASASPALRITAFLPPMRASSARTEGGTPAPSRALNSQYSSGLKAARSASRSTMRRRATDCTRPAEMPRLMVFQSRGEIL